MSPVLSIWQQWMVLALAAAVAAGLSRQRRLGWEAAGPWALIVMVWGLHGGWLTHGTFTQDDALLLRVGIDSSPWQLFAAPDQWNRVSIAFLTPLQVLSLKLDHWLFGLDATGYFAHHLLSLSLLMALLFPLVRRCLESSGVAAFLVCAVWAISTPFAEVAARLMDRHYIEGLIFALLAIHCVFRAQPENSRRWQVAAAVCYAMAATSKEVFVPLPLILLLIGSRSIPARLRSLAPVLLVAVAYPAWRVWMLGVDNVLTSYGPFGYPSPYPVATATGVSAWIWGPMLVTICAWMVARRQAPVLLVFGLCTIAPIVGVIAGAEPRYLLLVTLVFLLALAMALQALWIRLRAPEPTISSLVLTVLAGAAVLLSVWQLTERSAQFRRAEAIIHTAHRMTVEFLTEPTAPDVVLYQRWPPASFLRHWERLSGEAMAFDRICFDRCDCPNSTLHRVRSTGIRPLGAAPVHHCALAADPSFSVTFAYDPDRRMLDWEFTPANGQFKITLPLSSQLAHGNTIKAAAKGTIGYFLYEPNPVRVHLIKPGSGRVSSDTLLLSPADETVVVRWP